MPDGTVRFRYGSQVRDLTVHFTLPSPGEFDRVLTGTIPAGLDVPPGEVWALQGEFSLQGDLLVHGTLITDGDVHGLCNGYEIHCMDGGTTLFRGRSMGRALIRWGDPIPAEWEPWMGVAFTLPDASIVRVTLGDLIANPPAPVESLAALAAANPDAGINPHARVALLYRSVVFEDMSRLMFLNHYDIPVPFPQLPDLRWVNFKRCGRVATSLNDIGFYAPHFHLLGDTTRGVVVEGVVAEDGGFHSFVAHHSHGVTFRDCHAINNTNTPFWWDTDFTSDLPSTDDTLYEDCTVLGMTGEDVDPPVGGVEASAFLMGVGDGNVARRCEAWGARLGFFWSSRSQSAWGFEDCLAVDNGQGIRIWQNAPTSGHRMVRFVSAQSPISALHGAYTNSGYRYLYCVFSSQFIQKAQLQGGDDGQTPPRQWNGDISGTDFCVFEGVYVISDHVVPGLVAPRGHPLFEADGFTNVDGWFKQGVRVAEDERTDQPSKRGSVGFHDCAAGSDRHMLEPSDFDMVSWNDDGNPATRLRIWRGGVIYRTFDGATGEWT